MAQAALVFVWIAITAYALFGGADFGAGIWDLLAGGARRGERKRALIERVIGPIWEANHVWLIFVIVVLWTGFPLAFSSIGSTMFIPLTAAAGIIGRGSGFAFRKVFPGEIAVQRVFGAGFAGASLLTPFFLGAVAGGVASGRVPVGNARGDVIGSWVNPTSLLGGTLAVLVAAFLAAVFLTFDADREAGPDLVEWFRVRAIATGLAAGAVALAGIAVLRADAPYLYHGLTGRGLGFVVASAAGGLAAIVLLLRRRYVPARLAAGLAVAAVLWGWGAAQYPFMLVGSLTVDQAEAAPATLSALVASMSVGMALVVPALAWLYTLFQRTPAGDPGPSGTPQDKNV